MLTGDGWRVASAEDYAEAVAATRSGSLDAVIIGECGAGASVRHPQLDNLLRIIETQQIAAIMITDRLPPASGRTRSLIDYVLPEVTAAEIRGRFAMIERYQAHLKRLEQELRNMERLGKRLNEHFREVDQEMRLAARLQHDFLPRLQEPIENARFASVYRPASWVSGDIFDVFRIDEEYTGFYVADAVGHGMAASLLTMFIRQAMVPKRVENGSYTVLRPSEMIANLNDALADQSLPNCQFVTAYYALLNHRTLTLQFARGGHPYPTLITPDGVVNDLKSPGGLLGLFKGEEFPTFETQLCPGDKLLLFTDGVELAFQERAHSLDTDAYRQAFASVAHRPIHEMLRAVELLLDEGEGSLNPRDDVTIVGLEILDP